MNTAIIQVHFSNSRVHFYFKLGITLFINYIYFKSKEFSSTFIEHFFVPITVLDWHRGKFPALQLLSHRETHVEIGLLENRC